MPREFVLGYRTPLGVQACVELAINIIFSLLKDYITDKLPPTKHIGVQGLPRGVFPCVVLLFKMGNALIGLSR